MSEHKVLEVSDYTKDWSFTPKTGGAEVMLTTFYTKVEGLDGIVDVNKKYGSDGPKVGDVLTGTFTESDFVDKQGNAHYRFKAERKFGGVDLSGVEASLARLEEKLDKVLAAVQKPVKEPENGSNSKDKVYDVLDGEPVNLDDISF